MRIRLPALRTLPSSTVATLSARPTAAIVVRLPLNENAEVRAATRNPRIFASTLSSSSARPSEKYSSSSSRPRFTNGSTATDGASGAGGVDRAVRGTGTLTSGVAPPASRR